jgi:hypothetical protein
MITTSESEQLLTNIINGLDRLSTDPTVSELLIRLHDQTHPYRYLRLTKKDGRFYYTKDTVK